MRRTLLALLAAASLATPATQVGATADGPDAWRVHNVASWDRLNVRVGPGTSYFVIASLPHDMRGIQLGVCTPTVTRDQYFAMSPQMQANVNGYTPWCLIYVEGMQIGWVNRNYLAEDGGS